MQDLRHCTVLLEEAVNALIWRPDGIYIDGTFGRGGHSQLVLERLGADARLVAFDKDPQALLAAQQITDRRFEIVHSSFANLQDEMAQRGVRRVAGILLDLGVSSPQLDDPERGFSFQADGPLDMRMDSSRGESAAQWLARVPQQQLTEVIRDYGEERFAHQIAKAIIARRAQAERLGPITRTRELAEIVASAVKTREPGKNPATRTFQAIRIYLNQELEELEIALAAALTLLEPGGRLVVISFHSLEDRIVKQFLKKHAMPPMLDRRLPIRAADLPMPLLKLHGRIRASTTEIALNPRARSALLRCAEKVAS